MAITAYEAASPGRQGKPYPGSDQESTRNFHVLTDSWSQTEFDILFAGVLPTRGDEHPESPLLFAFDLNLKQHPKNPTFWEAQVKYKTDTFSQREKDQQALPNPLDRPAEIEWGSVAYNVPIEMDLDGEAICKSAGDSFDPPIEMVQYYWCAHVTRNVAAVPLWIIDYAGAVNNADYEIDGVPVAALCSRLVDIKIGIRSRENGYAFRPFRYSIEFRAKRPARDGEDEADIPCAFDAEVLDQGFHLWDGTNKRRIYTTDTPRQPVSQPVLLDGMGLPLDNPTTATAVFRKFRTTGRKDFSELPLT